jgi:hypothetical protein
VERTLGSSAGIGGKSGLPLEALPFEVSLAGEAGIFDTLPLVRAKGSARLVALVVFLGALGMVCCGGCD